MQDASDGSVGVEHDSELSSHGSRRKISSELCSYCSSVSMSLGDSAPDDSESAVVGSLLCLVDEGDTLAEVEVSVFLVVDTLDSEKSELLILGGNASLEASEYSLLVQSKRGN